MAKLASGTHLAAAVAAITCALGACTSESTPTETYDGAAGRPASSTGGATANTGGAQTGGATSQGEAGKAGSGEEATGGTTAGGAGGKPTTPTGGTEAGGAGGKTAAGTAGGAGGKTTAGGAGGKADSGTAGNAGATNPAASCDGLPFMGQTCSVGAGGAGGAGGASGEEYMTLSEYVCTQMASRARPEVFSALRGCLELSVTTENMCDSPDPADTCLANAFYADIDDVDLIPGSDYSCDDLVAGCADDANDPLTVADCNDTLRVFNTQARANIIYCYACQDPTALDDTLTCGSLFRECVFPSLADASESYPYPGTCTESAGGAGGAGGAGAAVAGAGGAG